jgi:hypothetical protein
MIALAMNVIKQGKGGGSSSETEGTSHAV